MTSDQDRLIAALAATPETSKDDGYLTFREIMRLLSMSDNTLYKLLHQLEEAGRLECKRVPRRTMTGNIQAVPAYRLRNETDNTTS
jgi:predicted DNA-binding transcriptional regulator AlpA